MFVSYLYYFFLTTKKYSIIKFFNLLNPFSVEKDKLADPFKIAFGGVLAAAAILILMLSKNPQLKFLNDTLRS